tara:strand:+ start:630 stop:812 length:183 start_codon:yes stop_codon:yes gene_type:complete
MIKDKNLIQANVLKYAKSVVLLSDDINSDNVFQMLSVIKNSLKHLEKSIYTTKYNKEEWN